MALLLALLFVFHFVLWCALRPLATYFNHPITTHTPNRTTHTQTLYKNRLCKCKPRAPSSSSSSSNGEGDASSDLATVPAKTAQDFSELIGLCRAWEKDARLASLALEGALCCLRSLKSRPAGGGKGKGKGAGGGDGGGGGEALDTALKALAAAVGDFFGKRRGGGLTAAQVCNFAPVCMLRRWCGWCCFVLFGLVCVRMRACRAVCATIWLFRAPPPICCWVCLCG